MSSEFGQCMLAAAAALCISCSVLEEREECPCFLTLDFSGIESAELMAEGYDRMGIRVGSGYGLHALERWSLENNVEEYGMEVPRSTVQVMVACVKGAEIDEDGLTIAEGEQCPEIQMFADSFDADASESRRYVELHRNFCTLSVDIKTSYNVPARPFRVRTYGCVCGYSPDGTPKEGNFMCMSAPSSGGPCAVRIPRQKDHSLSLQVLFLDSDEVRTFPVGEYIAESGYDWSARDLKDIFVEMDFSRTGISFNISGWKKTLSYEMIF